MITLEIIDKVEEIFLNTNFANLFATPGLFKLQAAAIQLNPKKFAKWFDEKKLPIVENAWFNCVNTITCQQEIYSQAEFQKYGYGELLSRTIAIPGFIDKNPYFDGGLSENPCLSQWAKDETSIFVSQLMMPYRSAPTGRLESLFYAWEFKAFEDYQHSKDNFKNLITIYPHIDDVKSTDFGMSKTEKQAMILTAYHETKLQIEYFNLNKNKEPKYINMALSGGGIRSGAHIGVIRALYEYNIIPTRWSGTSGGAIIAILFAGYSAASKNR